MTSFPQPSLDPRGWQDCELPLSCSALARTPEVPLGATHPTGIGPTVHSSSRCRWPGYRRTTWEHQAEKFWCTSCTKGVCGHVGGGSKSEPAPAHRQTMRIPTPAVNSQGLTARSTPLTKWKPAPPPRCDVPISYVRCYHLTLECGMYARCPPLPRLPSLEQNSSLASSYLE